MLNKIICIVIHCHNLCSNADRTSKENERYVFKHYTGELEKKIRDNIVFK